MYTHAYKHVYIWIYAYMHICVYIYIYVVDPVCKPWSRRIVLSRELPAYLAMPVCESCFHRFSAFQLALQHNLNLDCCHPRKLNENARNLFTGKRDY